LSILRKKAHRLLSGMRAIGDMHRIGTSPRRQAVLISIPRPPKRFPRAVNRVCMEGDEVVMHDQTRQRRGKDASDFGMYPGARTRLQLTAAPTGESPVEPLAGPRPRR